MYIYIYTHICIHTRISQSDVCLQSWHQDPTTPLPECIFPYTVLGNLRIADRHPPLLFAPLYLPVLFMSANVRIILHICIHMPTPYCIYICTCPHQLGALPPSLSTHKEFLCACSQTHTPCKKRLKQKRERKKETERECSWGGLAKSAVVGATGYICKCSRIVFTHVSR